MKALKIVLNIIVALLSLACASVCFWHPFGMQIGVGYVSAIFLGVLGIAAIINFFITKKEVANFPALSAANTIGLVFGIIAVILMILNLCYGLPFQAIWQAIMANLFMIYIIIEGVKGIITAFEIKKSSDKSGWVAFLIVGILAIIAGIAGFGNAAVVIGFAGILMGVAFVIAAVNRILDCFDMD